MKKLFFSYFLCIVSSSVFSIELTHEEETNNSIELAAILVKNMNDGDFKKAEKLIHNGINNEYLNKYNQSLLAIFSWNKTSEIINNSNNQANKYSILFTLLLNQHNPRHIWINPEYSSGWTITDWFLAFTSYDPVEKLLKKNIPIKHGEIMDQNDGTYNQYGNIIDVYEKNKTQDYFKLKMLLSNDPQAIESILL